MGGDLKNEKERYYFWCELSYNVWLCVVTLGCCFIITSVFGIEHKFIKSLRVKVEIGKCVGQGM